jgi:mono/diheme cytochrome c family protein
MRLATGIAGTPMPSYLDIATSSELWEVAYYVRSMAGAPSLEAAALERAQAPLGAGEAPRVRGEYLVKSGTCFLCHVRMQEDGSYVEGSFGAGGMRVEITHGPTLHTRNLTPDPETGLGKWTPDDLRRALRDGRTPEGRGLNPLDMPWTVLAALDDGDIDAIHAYLTSLPPVKNPLPLPSAPSLWSGVLGKLLTFATGGQIAGVYFPGGPPARGASGTRQGWPAAEGRVLVVCLAVLAAYVGLRHSRRPLEAWLVVTLLVLTPLVYAWPPLAWMPSALVRADGAWGRFGEAIGLPPIRRPPAPETADDDMRALATRGQYVAALGTCSLCHTAGPDPLRLWQPVGDLAGGMRVSWQVFGTAYSRNLTPDRETGLGRWSDAEIRRAITSGISRDGRLMHWQAMPWDHFSHLKLEDLYALTVYLRHVPAIRSAVPPPAPPLPTDAAGDSFSFGYTGRLGR